MANMVYQLKVTLRGMKPPVWRRILVGAELSLGELASILEGAMGWFGGHLHAFDVDGSRYGTPNPEWGTDDLDENKYRLRDVLSVGSKMRWDYDFGDGWEHTVVVEKVVEAEPGVEYPVCLAGRRACPPEDCGGPYGYDQLLAALADPGHPEYEELSDWVSVDFDPCLLRCRGGQSFDAVATTVARMVGILVSEVWLVSAPIDIRIGRRGVPFESPRSSASYVARSLIRFSGSTAICEVRLLLRTGRSLPGVPSPSSSEA